MKFIWFQFFVEVSLLGLIKPIVRDFEGIALLAVLLHMIITMVVLATCKSEFKQIFLGAFFFRLAFMFWDIYASHIFALPNSGADSIGYYNSAVAISQNLLFLKEPMYGGLYSKIIGTIFSWAGSSRLLGQYINVLLGFSVVIIIYEILVLLDINSIITGKVLLIVAFFPNSLIMSAVFLREIITTFFVAISFYHFIMWFEYNKFLHMLISIIFLGIASIFHSGVIGILLGYVFAFLFYSRGKNSFRFTSGTVVSFILLIIILSLGVTSFGDLLFLKFRNVESMSDIYDTANRRLGGSAYLTSLKINNPIQLVIFGPIKSFFFLTVPLPMNWRGFLDIFTFFTDSLLYLSVIFCYVKNKKWFGDRKALAISIMVTILGASIIFGIGVSNAGTAVRHRQKLVPLVVTLFAVIKDEKNRFLVN